MAISVLMTVFNGQRWLREAIDSVLNQTYSDFEFLIVDDGSTDGTPDILEQAARRDGRIRVIRHENMGVSRSANLALREAKHDWVARFDADDLMTLDRLERQVAFLEANPDVVVASCLADYIDDEGRNAGYYDNPLTTRSEVQQWIDSGKVIYFIQSGAIMRRDIVELVGGYRPEFTVTEDTDLWNRIAEAGYSVLVQPVVLMQVRVHGSSLTRSSLMLQARQFRWLEDCAARRRSGRPEISFDSFLKQERESNVLARMNIARKDYGSILYKRAAIERTGGSLLAMLMFLGLATLMYPSYAIGNVWGKAFRPRVRREEAIEATAPAPGDVDPMEDRRSDRAA